MGLADLDDEFETVKPPERKGGGGLAALPDGDYTFAVKGAQAKDTKAGPMVQLDLEVLSGGGPFDGHACEHLYFLKGKDGKTNEVALSQLKKDLETLGFDVPNWTKANGRPFSAQLELAFFVLAGVRFRGKKKTNKGYANLYVEERATDDGRPATFGPDELKKPADGFDID